MKVTNDYQTNIGLEIHVQLKTKSKMFCSCENEAEGKEPNTLACPICMGFPGVLPVINKKAVELTIKTALALNCQIAQFTQWHRKNYFYPDLPKGYQISQYDLPLSLNGFLEIEGRKIGIRRVHLEEDTAKLLHFKDYSLVDFNRAGIPLMEIVTEPDITSPSEAKEFCQVLQMLLRNLEVSNADMEKGEMRCEANVSLKIQNAKIKSQKLGTKVEIKNLNSFRAIERALNYEIERQRGVLERGEEIVQETRGWDPVKNKTFSQRWKEEAPDYRYFPEPDLPPLFPYEIFDIPKMKKSLPKTLEEREKELLEEIGLPRKQAMIFLKDLELLLKLEEIKEIGQGRYLKTAGNLLVNFDIAREIDSQSLFEISQFLEEGKIQRALVRPILEEVLERKKSPREIIKERGLKIVKKEEEVEKVVKKVLKENKKAVSDYQKGKVEALQFLIGQIMRETKGQADPEIVKKLLRKELR